MSLTGETLHSIAAPDRFDSRVGSLESADGVPSGETAKLMYDHLDFVHALNVYLDGFAAASTYALRKGFHDLGVEDNSILIFSELMGSESVFDPRLDRGAAIRERDRRGGPLGETEPPLGVRGAAY